MEFTKFIEWAFLGLMTGAVYILWLMKESISSLNTKIEVLVSDHEYSKKELIDHEDRIRTLEQK